MIFTRDQACQTLASLNPAPIFLESYRTKRLPENLDLFFRPPEEFFLYPTQQELYTQGRLIPLLDDGQFSLVTYFDPATRELVQISVESPEEAPRNFPSWSHYLADLMIRLGESIDDDEQLHRIAGLIHFPHLEATIALLDEIAPLPYAEHEKRKREFISNIA